MPVCSKSEIPRRREDGYIKSWSAVTAWWHQKLKCGDTESIVIFTSDVWRQREHRDIRSWNVEHREHGVKYWWNVETYRAWWYQKLKRGDTDSIVISKAEMWRQTAWLYHKRYLY